MKNRKKIFWIWLLGILLLVNFLAFLFHYRIDLTAEKRFTLSTPTKRLLQNLKAPVSITVLLSGDMPAGFKKLQNSTEDLLNEFKDESNGLVQYKFEKPGEGLPDSLKSKLADSLYRLGINVTNVKAQVKAGESEQQQYIYPGALISYQGRKIGLDLLRGQNYEGGLNSLNNAEALLEYKFISSIHKVSQDTLPYIGYLIGNGEPISYNVYDLIERTLKANYPFGILQIDSVPVIPSVFNLIFIVKPSSGFSEKQKLKLDQYVMHGGKIIWLIDQLYAEMDSLQRTKSDFIAFDRSLNLDDILFKYGVRINRDLVQDLQCQKIPLVIGNYGNKPQVEFLPWPYFPLLTSYGNHPISKNLDNILSIFPNSIDTVKADNLKKTILLTTSNNSRTLATPAIVSWNSVKVEEDQKSYNRSHIPVAVLLEGKFNSLYANRISGGLADTMSNFYHQPFAQSIPDNKMIVISDGDLVVNVVTQSDGPLNMGMDQFNKYQYANKDFILNCIEYLTDVSGILVTRAKDYTLRLLDVKKTEEEKTKWQLINVGFPVVLVVLVGMVFLFIRKRKYV